ncbi:MAG: hypothetical protein KGL64_11490, partial [Acidobacteriota bacterium]|nr:hypothetical protein [Acidobacteriota bacterium]
MNLKLNTTAAAILAVSLAGSLAFAGAPPESAQQKSGSAKKAAKPTKPSVEDQIQALREEMEQQINSLKNDLAEKNAELQKAQQ